MSDTRRLTAEGLRVPMRERFAQQMDQLEENPEDLVEAFEEADKHLQDSFGFRWGAQSTLNKQDRALNPPLDPEVHSSEHDVLKRKDGWYSADFEGVKIKKRAQKPKKTKQPTPKAQYNMNITELPPGTPGIWAQEPTAVGLVEFGRSAAENALRSVHHLPKEFLTTDVASVAGPALYQRFGDHLLQDPREFKLSAAAKSLLKPASQVGTRQMDFYPDANALYILRQKELEEQRLRDGDEMDLDEEEEETEEKMDSDHVEVGSEGEAE
ncbi:hypothetical protein KC320_g7694 [Hortaea werneckii]|nr:hypothetical protein KC320_g7694 [Hortaea werneckii]